jgi:hypothetical protein
VDLARATPADPVELSRAVVTQGAAVARSQNSGHEEAKSRHFRPPDRVDAAEDHVEPAGRKTPLDGLPAVAEREELLPGDHPVLPPDECPYLR